MTTRTTTCRSAGSCRTTVTAPGYGQNGYYKTGGVNSDGASSADRLNAVRANVDNLKKFTEYANSKGVSTGLWTQSNLEPDSNPETPWHLLR